MENVWLQNDCDPCLTCIPKTCPKEKFSTQRCDVLLISFTRLWARDSEIEWFSEAFRISALVIAFSILWLFNRYGMYHEVSFLFSYWPLLGLLCIVTLNHFGLCLFQFISIYFQQNQKATTWLLYKQHADNSNMRRVAESDLSATGFPRMSGVTVSSS